MPSMPEDREAIRELLHRYCYGTDTGDVESWVGVFTEDCLWDGGPFGVCRGRSGLRAMYQQGGDAAKALRHLTLNTLMEVEGNQARAVSYVLVLATADAGSSVFFSGFYQDELIRSGGRWWIAKRMLRRDMSEMRLPCGGINASDGI
jgi:3-phenylpropionate/cinnamic acid dioxygenase small subunit